MIGNAYITEENKNKIISAADNHLLEVISNFVSWKPDGTAYLKADCHYCGRPDTLKYNKSKKLFKCFHCDNGGKTAVSYLTKIEGKEWHESMLYLADMFNISLEPEKDPEPPKKESSGDRIRKAGTKSFRDLQLLESGIPESAQKYWFQKDSVTKEEHNRYESGTFDQYGEITRNGDDMLLHYLDIDGRPILFKGRNGKERSLIRVRYQNPDIHPDKDGKPIKYQSPSGSGSHLWIPQMVIQAYKNGRKFSKMIICEGEKKADKLCTLDICAVGIMGIHNFAYTGEMPHQFEMMLKKFEIKNVIFLLDTDWQDLSISVGKPVDTRPASFFKAVKKFKDYFYAYNLQNISLKIFFGHHISETSKGIDDFIVRELKGREKSLKDDIKNAIIERTHTGDFVQLYDITSDSDYKIKEYWSLHSWPAFIEKHKEQLIQLREFNLGGLKRRVNADGDIELAEKLLPHEKYWIINEFAKTDSKRKIFTFDYLQIKYFLKNRGFGLYKIKEDLFRLIKRDGRIIQEVNSHFIQHYVYNFTEELDDENKKDILRMLARGSTQYLGPDKLSGMYFLNDIINFHKAEKDTQYLFFKESFVKITKDDIQIRPINELTVDIWRDKVIDFEPKILDQKMINIRRANDTWKVKLNELTDKSDFARFIYLTSWTYWKKYYKMITMPDGKDVYIQREPVEYEKVTEQEDNETNDHYVSKLLAIGYIMHEYFDMSVTKAIIAMDMIETEVGRSQGGTGKSIFSTMFEHLIPTYIIDGKTPKMVDDPHLYEGVDERTKAIVFDDCRVNFDFEFLFSAITRGLTVNPKGKTKYTITPPPKFIINTNHAFNGEGNSFERRQYLIAFTDYFNGTRTPYDEFGRIMFADWDFDQWNYFYNFIFECIQMYLKYGLKYSIPRRDIERRMLRQKVGENFIEWALGRWDKSGYWLNQEVEKKYALNDYLFNYPNDKKYVDIRRFKEKCRYFAKYAGLSYNPHRGGGLIKSNNDEYICLADADFDAMKTKKIKSLTDEQSPF